MPPQNSWHARFPHYVRIPLLREYEHWLKQTGRMTTFLAEKVAMAYAVKRRVVYVAGPLTALAEELKTRYIAAATLAEELGFFGYVPHIHGTDPVKHPQVSPDEVRDADYLWAVVKPSVHINFLWPIGHGNAIEAGWAEIYHLPAIFCVPAEVRLSRLTVGLLNVHCLIRYPDEESLFSMLRDVLEKDFSRPS